MNTSMQRFQLSEWLAEQIRLTVFPMPDSSGREPAWWEGITGSQPDLTKANPKKGSVLVEGGFGAGNLALKLEPDRIDWMLSPPEPEYSLFSAPEFPVLGAATETIPLFAEIAERWLSRDDIPAINRIAFGAVLLRPVADRGSGYQRLPSYVPVTIDPESSDFLYQINLPSVHSGTGIPGLRLNRLSKWSVATTSSITVRVSGSTAQAQSVPQTFALRLELDINTVPTFEGALAPNKIVEVYKELVAEGLKIATNGVVKQ